MFKKIKRNTGKKKPDLVSAYSEGLEAVQKALEAGADPNSLNQMGISVLANASFDGRLAIVKALILKHADVNLPNRNSKTTPLMMAVTARHIPIIDALLAAGANPDLMNSHGDSALSIAKKNSPAIEGHIHTTVNEIKTRQLYIELITDKKSLLSTTSINADLQYLIFCFLAGKDTKVKVAADTVKNTASTAKPKSSL